MATWKVNGEVPDSDDEENLENQSTASDVVTDEPLRHVDEDDDIDQLQWNGDGIDRFGERQIECCKINCGTQLPSHPPSAHLPTSNFATQQEPASSPDPLKTSPYLQDPPLSDPVGRDVSVPGNIGVIRPSNPNISLPQMWGQNEVADMDEENARTYVMASSPMSSLSSLPSSPLGFSDFYHESVGDDNEPTPETSPRTAQLLSQFAREEAVNSVTNSTWAGRRALRHRNPIQLHPYALEGEKYRRTLMARGMRPLRLAQIRDRVGSMYRSESHDTEFEFGEASQGLGFEGEVPPMSSSPPQASLETIGDPFAEPVAPLPPTNDLEEEEFPDIADLVNNTNVGAIRVGKKRRRVQYKSKGHRPRSPEAPDAQTPICSTTQVDVFDVPLSPPATSSPFLTSFADRSGKRALSALSQSEPAAAISVESEDEHMQDITSISAKSVVENVENPSPVDLDETDPFASDSASVVSSSSEPEELTQMKRVGMKIRGVLPASWLRLDQQTRPPDHPFITSRESQSPSPPKAVVRRGVAVPKRAEQNGTTGLRTDPPVSYFLSDEESDDEDATSLPGLAAEGTTTSRMNSTAPPSELGFAIEDDRVDAMLPSQKRQARFSSNQGAPNRRKVRKSLFQETVSRSHQPKITKHVSRTRQPITTHRRGSRSQKGRASIPNARHRASTRPFLAPKLSILDVVQQTNGQCQALPAFIRIAARTSRQRKGLGRHSPSRKFIRLGNREDTVDALSSLNAWREGTIPQQAIPASIRKRSAGPRAPLRELPNNGTRQKQASLVAKSNMAWVASPSPRQRGNNTQQTQITCSEDGGPQHLDLLQRSASQTTLHGNKLATRKDRSSEHALLVRPAQLETTETEYRHHYPDIAFRSTKKTLDALYKRTHKGATVRGDVQLARFLADDVVVPTPVVLPSVETQQDKESNEVDPEKIVRKPPRLRRKHSPKRVDVGAAKYRQPREPLVLDSIQPTTKVQSQNISNGKLLGLGKFGTVYTHDFDIFPIQSGIYFHDSTFIGSGRLSSILDSPALLSGKLHSSFQIGRKRIEWAEWNANVSSEVGVCFDWIFEGLETVITSDSIHESSEILDCLMFIVEYVQRDLRFSNQHGRHECLARFVEVLRGSTDRLANMACRCASLNNLTRHRVVDLSVRHLVLVLQVLLLARTDQSSMALSLKLEDLLQRAASACISLLLSFGLQLVRNLYDDLQYLTFREAGIRSERYAVQAWLITIQVLGKARIPRVSFWTIFNAELVKDHLDDFTDARILERVWYSIFTLLPLFEFDKLGVVVSGSRHTNSHDNWALPQQMLKKVFQLYAMTTRQSPSFNDYCRALFSRCHLLMQVWGWRRCGSIVGTMFDFFASQRLAHLRNEEVYKSPRFLEELHQQPSLEVETEDRCFHILLKIIAISIRHMQDAGDMKGIRNLVTRLLPNHDRQYPKEEIVHQRDLASLRNHHDILCTLFWAAPPELRPSMNLIRELVNPESSHKEAYMINLRAWTNLARFVLISNPTAAAYEPFALWQSESFTQILALYHSAGRDVEDQLLELSDSEKRLITQNTIAATVRRNRFEIMGSVVANLSALRGMIMDASHMDVARLIMCNHHTTVILVSAMKRVGIVDGTGTRIVEAALSVVEAYLTRLNDLVPVTSVRLEEGVDEDSQDYGDNVFDEGSPRLEYTGELDGQLKHSVRDLLKRCLRSLTPLEKGFVLKVVDTWGHLAGTLIVIGLSQRLDFLSDSGDLILDGELIPSTYGAHFRVATDSVSGSRVGLS